LYYVFATQAYWTINLGSFILFSCPVLLFKPDVALQEGLSILDPNANTMLRLVDIYRSVSMFHTNF
ncbi:hypothetical protein ACJX0J_031074, partial [Zea mays]